MIRILTTSALTAASLTAAALTAPAWADGHACPVEGDPWDLDDAGVAALYDCMNARMQEGYTKQGDETAAVYRDWAPTSTRPAVVGPHGERFLNTFANEIAAEQYLKFEEGAFEMPVGSILAKESIAIRDGEARVGPLFLMTKVDDAGEFDNWVYAGVQPDGKPLRISQSFCHDCHAAFDASDSMGYPLEEVRFSN